MTIWSTMGDMMPRSMDMEAKPTKVIDSLERQVDKRGNVLYSLPGGGMVKDNGGRIHYSRTNESQQVATLLARRKFGSHYIQQGTNTLLAGRYQQDSIVYELAPNVQIRETENAISFPPDHPAAKQAALGLAGRKFEGREVRVNKRGVIVDFEKDVRLEGKHKICR